jgi:CBS domain-containing protein
LSPDESQGLVEAFELMWQVRLEHQSRCIEHGHEPDDLVEPQELGPLTRQALKEAFRMIDRAQDRLAALIGIRR